jgi:hypothetical protein
MRPSVVPLVIACMVGGCGAATSTSPAPEAPPADTDGDTITDEADACPTEAEDVDEWQDEDGCPDPDNDGDGVPDAEDMCPFSLEVQDDCPEKDGCPGSHCHPCEHVSH